MKTFLYVGAKCIKKKSNHLIPKKNYFFHSVFNFFEASPSFPQICLAPIGQD